MPRRGQKKGKLIVSYLENTLHLLRDCVEKKCGEKRRAGAIEETEILSARENERERVCERMCVSICTCVYVNGRVRVKKGKDKIKERSYVA